MPIVMSLSINSISKFYFSPIQRRESQLQCQEIFRHLHEPRIQDNRKHGEELATSPWSEYGEDVSAV